MYGHTSASYRTINWIVQLRIRVSSRWFRITVRSTPVIIIRMIPDQTSWKRVLTYMYTDIYIYIYTYTYTYISLTIVYNVLYVYAHIYVHICAYMCMYVYIYIYIYAYISLYYNTFRNEGALSTYYLVIYNNLLYLKTFLYVCVYKIY